MVEPLSKAASLILPIVAFLALASSAAAFSLHASADSVEFTSCSDGFLRAWVEGAAPGSTARFSASGAPLGTFYFDPGYAVVPPYENAASSEGRVASSLDTFGSGTATVSATVCKDNVCQTQSTFVRLSAMPCGATPPYASRYQSSPQFTPAVSCGSTDCRNTISAVQRTRAYNPTPSAALLYKLSPTRCFDYSLRCDYDQLHSNQALVSGYAIANGGSWRTYSLRIVPDDSSIRVTPGSSAIDLSPGQAIQIPLTVRAAPDATPGIHGFTIQLLYQDSTVASARDWVQIIPDSGATAQGGQITLPKITARGTAVPECSLGKTYAIEAELENTGSGRGDFLVWATLRGEQVFIRRLTVSPGITAAFAIDVPSEKLQAGANAVAITGKSGELYGSGTATVEVTPCNGTANAGEPSVAQADSQIAITITVQNTLRTPLSNVTAHLEGIPPAWSQSAETVEISPEASRQLALRVNATTGEQVSPTLVITSNGKAIATKKLAPLGSPSNSLTAFFTRSLGGNAGLLGLGALALLLLGAFFHIRSRTPSATGAQTSEQAYLAKLRRIRSNSAGRDGADTAPANG